MSCWLAIVNPHSGGGRSSAHLPRVLEDLRRVTERTVVTAYPGHAAELAKEATHYRGLAVVGGDGTLFEILKGIDLNKQRLAIIPMGRGNSLARDLGLLRQRPGIELNHSSNPILVDLLEVAFTDLHGVERQSLSASTVSLGYPATVAKAATRFNRLGQYCYAAAAASVRPVSFCVEISCERGRTHKKHLKGIVANNTRHIANFLAFPRASCCDGFFDLMELNAGYVRQSAHNLSALCGMDFFNSLDLCRARQTRLQLEEPQELMIDGESHQNVVSLEIRMRPAALACNQRTLAQ